MSKTTFSGPVSSQNGFTAGSFTTAERNALTNVATGTLIFNTTAGEAQVYDGTDWIAAFAPPAPSTVTYTDGVEYSTGGLVVTTMGSNQLYVTDSDWSDTAALSVLSSQPSGTAYTFDRSGSTYTFTTDASWSAVAGTHTVTGNITSGSGPFPGGPPYNVPAITFLPA